MKNITVVLIVVLLFSCTNKNSISNEINEEESIDHFDSFINKIQRPERDLNIVYRKKEIEIDSIYDFLIFELEKHHNDHYYIDMANLLIEEKNNYKKFYRDKSSVFGASFNINHTARYECEIYIYDLDQHLEYLKVLKENIIANYLEIENK